MYIITIKYYDGTEKVIKELDYSEACTKVSKEPHSYKSIHLKEVK